MCSYVSTRAESVGCCIAISVVCVHVCSQVQFSNFTKIG